MKKCSALALPSHHSPRVTRPPCELRPLCGLKSTQQILAVWIQKNKKDTKTLCGRHGKWSKLEHHIYPFSSDRKNRTQVSGCHLVIGQAIIKVQQCSGQAKKTRAPLADEKSSRLGRKRLSSNQSRNDSSFQGPIRTASDPAVAFNTCSQPWAGSAQWRGRESSVKQPQHIPVHRFELLHNLTDAVCSEQRRDACPSPAICPKNQSTHTLRGCFDWTIPRLQNMRTHLSYITG